MRAAEGVDALRVVAHDGELAVPAAHAAKDARLQQVGVLVLVHEHVLVQAGDARLELGRGLEHHRPEEEQVVVVDEVALLLAQRVVGEESGDLRLVLEELRRVAVQQLVERELGVDVPRVQPVQRLLLGKALGRLAEPQRAARELHQVLGVALVHDGEVGRQAGGRAELAQQAVADGVEGATVHPRAGRADEPFGARRASRCAARRVKVSRRMRSAAHASLDEGGDAVDEGARLAGAGAGDDEQRAVAEGGGARLVVVQRSR